MLSGWRLAIIASFILCLLWHVQGDAGAALELAVERASFAPGPLHSGRTPSRDVAVPIADGTSDAAGATVRFKADVTSCADASACAPCERCVSGACVPRETLRCVEDADCAPGMRCVYAEEAWCRSMCVSMAHDVRCTHDTDCAGCERCEQIGCVPSWKRLPCDVDDDCVMGQVCALGDEPRCGRQCMPVSTQGLVVGAEAGRTEQPMRPMPSW
jgi:hypothetical protein